ncbi:hypothetical protein As57867_007005, partial [Aphanomyces stellatus]
MATPRVQWISQRILESFEPALSPSEVTDFLGSPPVKKLFDELLAGKDGTKVFVHFQADPTDKGNDASRMRLSASTGNTLPIRSKCCYFLRITADGKAVDVTKGSDTTLLFGELAPNVLRDLESSLAQLFTPLFKAREDWGKADPELKVEFMNESEKFANDLREALHSMDSGLELRRPDREFENAGTRGSAVSESPQVIAHYEDVLKDWCDVISTYLETNTTSDGKTKDDEIDDDGPMGELEYWRRRMQRLTSITEQLKTNEYKDVFFVLSRTSKNVSDDTKQRIQTLLRRWKQTDISITEAANEAKDNVKYLFTLEKFIVPLYSGTPSTIIDTLPALMNSIKMIHSIARYYNTSERMASLLTKITNQMITNCKNCITGGETFEVMWTKEPEELVRNLDSCLKLNEAYQQQYRATKDKLFSMPKGKQFEFNEMQIFGKFDLFCRRIIKLIDMFTTIHQFSSLGQHKLEGMEELIGKFNGVIREFRLRNHDLLDYRNNRFDRDY